MPETKLSPLAPNVPIVDKDGNPTPYFQRMLDIWLKEKAVAEGDLSTVITDVDTLETTVANLELDDLADVDTATTPPDDGQALIWDDANSEWIPGDVASGGGGGSFEFIGRTSVSGVTEVDIDLPDDYDSFLIEFQLTPDTNAVSFNARVTTDGFATVATGAADYAWGQFRHTTSTGNVGDVSDSTMQLEVNQVNTDFNAGFLRVINAKEAAYTLVQGQFGYSAATFGGVEFVGRYMNNASVNGLRLYYSSGTATGFYKVYGLKTEVAPSASPGPWQLDTLWEHSVSGNTTTVLSGDLTGYNEVRVVFEGSTTTSSGARAVRVSVDGGANYLAASGDYKSIEPNGAVTSETCIFTHSTATTASRGGVVDIQLYPSGTVKAFKTPNRSFSAAGYISGSLLPINKIAVTNLTTGGSAAGDFSSGKIWILKR